MPFYSEHRTVTASLPIERTGSLEIDDGARQRRVEALLREVQESEAHKGASFSHVLREKQAHPSDNPEKDNPEK
ncbi:MAG: hypothetical protein FWG75_10875 [Cystobacterineae bacterium]|nr:hypothetical protein [Cystobacterineae bacterium]